MPTLNGVVWSPNWSSALPLKSSVALWIEQELTVNVWQ
jgi:hypothetical protein